MDAILRRLKNHDRLCTMHRYSLQEKRHCSCGRDQALKELYFLLWMVRVMLCKRPLL